MGFLQLRTDLFESEAARTGAGKWKMENSSVKAAYLVESRITIGDLAQSALTWINRSRASEAHKGQSIL